MMETSIITLLTRQHRAEDCSSITSKYSVIRMDGTISSHRFPFHEDALMVACLYKRVMNEGRIMCDYGETIRIMGSTKV